MLNQWSSYYLVPFGLTLVVIVTVVSNYIVIRVNRILLKIVFFIFAYGSGATIFIFFYVMSNALKHRVSALEQRRKGTTSKLMLRTFKACRVYNMCFGHFYYVNHVFMTVVVDFIINCTVTVLIASK